MATIRLAFGFEWGYPGTGPFVLGRALLIDRLGWEPDTAVTLDFEATFTSMLPDEFEIEIEGHVIDAWISKRLTAGALRSAGVGGR